VFLKEHSSAPSENPYSGNDREKQGTLSINHSTGEMREVFLQEHCGKLTL